MTQLLAACARTAPEVASAVSSASAYLTRPSLESFDSATIALRCHARHVARRIGGCRVHDLCHAPTSRCAAASGTRHRTAPTKAGLGHPWERRELVRSGPEAARARRDEGDAT